MRLNVERLPVAIVPLEIYLSIRTISPRSENKKKIKGKGKKTRAPVN